MIASRADSWLPVRSLAATSIRLVPLSSVTSATKVTLSVHLGRLIAHADDGVGCRAPYYHKGAVVDHAFVPWL